MNISTLDIDELGFGRITPKIVMEWKRYLIDFYKDDDPFSAHREFMEGNQWSEEQQSIMIRRSQ